MLRSLFSAFLMYSRIPVPKVEWKEENRRYALGFFPLVGAVSGLFLILWKILCSRLAIGHFLFSAIAVFIPILVTGGIHLDGFCDVCDARASYSDKEKRLEILSDPHIGSFAVIKLSIYLLIQTALFSQIETMRTTIIVAAGYILSRALSAVTAMTFRSAKNSGTLQSFVRPAHRNVTMIMDALFIALFIAVSIIISPIQGALAIVFSFTVLIYHRYASYRDFGGITGDLCGWFLQMCEMAVLASAVFSERIMIL